MLILSFLYREEKNDFQEKDEKMKHKQ